MAQRRESCPRDLFLIFRKSGDLVARDQIVEAHLELVRRLCRRFAHTPEPQEDLVQVGSVGLLKAIEKYDPDRGTSFVAFAVPEIMGEILNYFRDHGWAVKMPRKLQAQKVLVAKTAESLVQRWGRWPTIPEIGQAARMTEEEVMDAMLAERNGTALSLDGEGGSDDEGSGSLADSLGKTDPALDALGDRLLLEGPLATLDERERTIVHLSFYNDKTQTEIAQQLGISQMHVSRILRKAIAKLKQALSPAAITASQGGPQ